MPRPAFGSMDDIPVGTVVLAFDPGESTGWAAWHPLTRSVTYGQDQRHFVIDDFLHLLQRMNGVVRQQLLVVVENFIVPGRHQMKNDEIATPFKVIGQIEFLCKTHVVREPHLQLPAERVVASMDLLVTWGWLPKPQSPGRDAMSALQHLASYLLQNGVVPSRRNVVR